MAETPYASRKKASLSKPSETGHVNKPWEWQANQRECWMRIWIGTGVAGAVYPVVVAAILVVMAGAICSFRGSHSTLTESFFGVAGVAFMVILIAPFTGGVFWAIAFFLLSALKLALRLMRAAAPWPVLGALSGGAVGFLCLSPLLYMGYAGLIRDPSRFLAHPGPPLTALALGPLLATFCGQVGGAYGGYQSHYMTEWESVICRDQRSRGFSFSVRQLLGLTLIVSLVTAVLRVAGLLTPAMAVLAFSWPVVQLLTLWPAMRLARRLNTGKWRSPEQTVQQQSTRLAAGRAGGRNG